MAVITQEYDIDLKATGAFPVVKCSQFDTGSRKIVFTVYDGWDLAKIDGCLARVDGTRSDGVEFSRSCTVGTGSKVSFTITQEMTKHAGKHAAELVLFDDSGNPIGTQNFMIEVEAATMVRDSAASADDRTLYDQYTDSIEEKFRDLSNALNNKADAMNKTVEDISGLIGASSKPITVFDNYVKVNGTYDIRVRLTYDPVTALVHAYANGQVTITAGNNTEYDLYTIDSKYCPDEANFTDVIGSDQAYFISTDNLKEIISGDTSKNSNYLLYYIVENNGAYKLGFQLGAGLPDHEGYYTISFDAIWYARGGKYIGVSKIGTGGNTVTVGTTTTGEPGTQASVVNSGTAKDVVLDFTIPRGADGASGGGSSYTLPVATSSTLGGVKIGSGISITSDGTISASGGSGGIARDDKTISNIDTSTYDVSATDLGDFHLTMYGDVLYAYGQIWLTASKDTVQQAMGCKFTVYGLSQSYNIITVGYDSFNGLIVPVSFDFDSQSNCYVILGGNTSVTSGTRLQVSVFACTLPHR